MKVKNLSIEEVRLYFFLYTFLALVAVLWVGFVATSMMYPPREYAPPPIPVPASLPTPTPTPAPVKPGATVHQHHRALATSAAHLCGVPSKLFHRLIDRESAWRVHAVSSSGALGLAQIKPTTLRGVSPTLRPWMPSDRLVGAACYLRQMFDRHEGRERERWHAALLDYRYGPYRRETPNTEYADRILEVEE